MSEKVLCKDCANATYLGFCVAKHKWTVLDVPIECPVFVRRAREPR